MTRWQTDLCSMQWRDWRPSPTCVSIPILVVLGQTMWPLDGSKTFGALRPRPLGRRSWLTPKNTLLPIYVTTPTSKGLGITTGYRKHSGALRLRLRSLGRGTYHLQTCLSRTWVIIPNLIAVLIKRYEHIRMNIHRKNWAIASRLSKSHTQRHQNWYR